MVLVLPLALALTLGALLGGDIRRVAALRLRRVELFYVAIALQLVAFPFGFMPWHVSDLVARCLWLVSYGILCAAAFVNARIPGVPVIAAGMVSNIVAVAANGGHMPALPQALHAAHKHYTVSLNSARDATPHLPWLVDRWAVPRWVHLGNVYSFGDVVIAIGVIVLVLVAMRPRLVLRHVSKHPYAPQLRAAGDRR